MRENTDQNNSEYEHFSRSTSFRCYACVPDEIYWSIILKAISICQYFQRYNLAIKRPLITLLHIFFKSNAFFNSTSVLLNFSMNWVYSSSWLSCFLKRFPKIFRKIILLDNMRYIWGKFLLSWLSSAVSRLQNLVSDSF